MKNYISLFTQIGGGKFGLVLFCAFSLNFTNVYAQPQVGNGAIPPVPTLSQAIATTLSSGYDPVSNTLQVDFNIVGDFEFDFDCAILHSDIIIMPSGSGSAISKITEKIILEGSGLVLYQNSKIEVLSEFICKGVNMIGSTSGGTTIEVLDGGFVNFYPFNTCNHIDFSILNGELRAVSSWFNSSPINSDIGATSESPVVRLHGCFIENNTTQNAVTIKRGFYHGSANEYINNKTAISLGSGLPTLITNASVVERASRFEDNLENGVLGIGAYNLQVTDNCVFENTERPIKSEGVLLLEVIDNQISNVDDEFGIHISSTHSVLVDDNSLTDIASGGGNGAITVVNNWFGIVRNNIINNGGANGLRFINFMEGVIDDNTSNTSNCNINAEMGMGNYYNQNDLNNANLVNMAVASSTNLRATCNNAGGGPAGVLFSGDMQGLDFEKNSMFNHTNNGLTYNADAMAPIQEDKSNDWFFNTQDAEHEGGAFPASMSKYIVHPADMPSTFTPGNWFDPTGNTSLWNCLTFGGGGFFGDTPDEIAALVHSIDCAGHGLGPAYCMWHKMVALYLIDQDPSLLSDVDLANFHAIESGSVIDQLPVLWEIIQGLPHPNFPTMALTYDSLGEISNLPSYLNFMEIQLEPVVQQYEIDLATAILNRKNQINAIIPSNTLETDYKDMALHYMKSLEMGTFTTTEKNAIITMAESCFVNEGPAVYVARTIATKESWNYNIPTSCYTIGSHSAGLEDETSENMRVFPNPAMDVLSIQVSEDTESITIMDALGQSIDFIPTEGQTTMRLDLSSYMSGMYWFKADNENQPQKVTVQR